MQEPQLGRARGELQEAERGAEVGEVAVGGVQGEASFFFSASCRTFRSQHPEW
jgi:hypothetical protein